MLGRGPDAKEKTEWLKGLPFLRARIENAADRDAQLVALTKVRRVLSTWVPNPRSEVVSAGLVPGMIACLALDAFPQLQFEAGWALTNVVAGAKAETRAVWDAGVLPILSRAMASNQHSQVLEQFVWLVGNLTGTYEGSSGEEYRDKLPPVIIEPMLKILSTPPQASSPLLMSEWHGGLDEPISLIGLRTAVWTTSNLCRGKNPLPDFKLVCRFLPCLSSLLKMSDSEILADACTALGHLTSGPNDRIQAVLEVGVVPRLVELLRHHQQIVQLLALRTVGNILSGNDEQTQSVIDCRALPELRRLLSHRNLKIQKEALWSVSNVCASSSKHLQQVLELKLLLRTVGFIGSSPSSLPPPAPGSGGGASPAAAATVVGLRNRSKNASPDPIVLEKRPQKRMT